MFEPTTSRYESCALFFLNWNLPPGTIWWSAEVLCHFTSHCSRQENESLGYFLKMLKNGGKKASKHPENTPNGVQKFPEIMKFPILKILMLAIVYNGFIHLFNILQGLKRFTLNWAQIILRSTLYLSRFTSVQDNILIYNDSAERFLHRYWTTSKLS